MLLARFRARIDTIHQWIINHDDSWLFIIPYIGLAVVLSIWISLFWLVAVVGVHFALEWIRQQQLRQGFVATLAEVLWELKLDVSLVFFALALSLYMDVLLGVVGLRSAARLGSAARAGVRGSARFAAWERALRGLLLSVDDAAQVARAVGVRRNGDGDQTGQAAIEEIAAVKTESFWGSWTGRWGKGDWIAAGLGLVCLLLIGAAPWLTEHTFTTALATLAAELRPLPGN